MSNTDEIKDSICDVCHKIMKYRFAIEQIQKNTGKRFEILHLLGGGTKNSFLCQMAADSLGIPVIAGPTEATALGNILLQLIALRDIPDLDYGRKRIRTQEKVTEYSPNSRPEPEEAYHLFRDSYEKTHKGR